MHYWYICNLCYGCLHDLSFIGLICSCLSTPSSHVVVEVSWFCDFSFGILFFLHPLFNYIASCFLCCFLCWLKVRISVTFVTQLNYITLLFFFSMKLMRLLVEWINSGCLLAINQCLFKKLRAILGEYGSYLVFKIFNLCWQINSLNPLLFVFREGMSVGFVLLNRLL